ncbi:MAG: XylR family transcriptional regulator [Gemmataceae bacterium]|nr:XylR family transcriptional regulator [Gemmataceae bacterium]
MAQRRHVALLIESSREYGRGLLRGICSYVRTHGHWSVYLQSRGPEDPPPPWLRTWHGDGIIARIESRDMERAIHATGLPAVDVRGLIDASFPLIETDDRAVARLAFEHLAERAFRHFAYCGFAGANYSERRLRYFPRFVEEAGFACHMYEVPAPRRSVGLSSREQLALLFERQMLEWLKQLPRPIGIMACNDVCGQQVLNACRELEIPVPDEVAVVGVDNDSLYCELSDPPLSSVSPNTERIGYLAAEMLDRLIDGASPPCPKTFVEPTGVVTRQSTDVLAIEDAEVVAAVRFIRERACEGINVEDVIRHVPLARRALERRFRKYLGRSPNEEIVRVRVKRVQDLLAAPELSLGTIASLAGFKHAEYMSAVFRKVVGRPPSQLRGRRPK